MIKPSLWLRLNPNWRACHSPVITLRSASWPGTPMPATPPVTSPLSSGTLTVTPSTTVDHSPRVKLPKLSLKKKVNRDLTMWTTFWDTVESAVHNNINIMSIDKFNYLNSLLESVAAEAVSGLTLFVADYEVAITTLKWTLGSKQLIVKHHMALLLKEAHISSQHNFKGWGSSMMQWNWMSEAWRHLEFLMNRMVDSLSWLLWASCQPRYDWSLVKG